MPTNKHVFTLLYLLLSPGLFAQSCANNLGENIFKNGDFGTGTANILTPDPAIAPGFLYEPSPPPVDGFYTITNDMGQWDNLFNSWQPFADNSPDPNGYMMIVNAALQPGKFYEQEVTDLCENTEYQFSADVRNVIRNGFNEILPNVSFQLDDVTQFTTGLVPENERWNTYAFSFNTGPGQTSLTLSLSNNSPGGLGNDLALDNISLRACGPDALIAGGENFTVCQGGEPGMLQSIINGDQYDTPAFQWQQSFDEGATWVTLEGENDAIFFHTDPSSGFYYYRYLLANSAANLTNDKCRVVSNVKTVFVAPKRFEVIDTVCSGSSVAVGQNTYSTSGTTVDTLLSALGCDSIVTLRLTVVPDPGLTADFEEISPSCDYREDGSLRLVSVTNSTDPIFLTLLGEQQSRFEPLTGLGGGRYPYAITDRYGCSVSGTLTLESPNPFEVTLGDRFGGDDLTVELGEPVRFPVGATDSVLSYTWLSAESIDCPAGCERVEFVPVGSGPLLLTAVSRAGCVATDSVRITVVKNRRTYFASAFSPNGDGINDRFTVQGGVPNVVAIESLQIFDRWGALVFSGTNLPPNDPSDGWDGHSANGKAAATGTYVYSARVRFLDGEVEEFGGSLVLVR